MNPAIFFSAATASYAANCVLGIGVATGRVHTGRARWLHHALYVCTASLAAVAASSLVWSSSRAGWRLLPAAVPLAVIPHAGSGSPRHILVALAAAPFFVASLIKAWR
ncbi:MAG: hypothetical protein JWL94_750 [Microbacteriaceae bacterium]|nr:hypothetical protein [Microbacteriaceae bacterium]